MSATAGSRNRIPIWREEPPALDAAALTAALNQPNRLAALAASGLLDSAADPQFDRYTRLVRSALGVPLAVIALIDERRQVFKSASGLHETLARQRETPLRQCLGQWVVAARVPMVIDDTLSDSRSKAHAAVAELGVRAYAGVPLTFMGQVIGTLEAMDANARAWTDRELETLQDLCALLARVALPRCRSRYCRHCGAFRSQRATARHLAAGA